MSTRLKHVGVRNFFAGFALLLQAASVHGDQFHYQNILLGERAQGMGGAFCAVADDASGVYYNPAGIAFAMANDISGSANAFYNRTVTYKNTVGSDSFVEKSTGSVSPFVGALGKLDQLSPGLVWAFGIYQTDSELKDQDTTIGQVDSIGLLRYHRTSNMRASTSRYGAVLAKRLSANFSFGFGANAIVIDELLQEYQDVETFSASSTTRTIITQNQREHLTGMGLEPVLGLQYSLGGSLSLGLTLKSGVMLSQTFTSIREATTLSYNSESGTETEGETVYNQASLYRDITPDEVKNPLELPMEIRSGFAWFASTRFLLTGDVMHYGEAKGKLARYDREAVTNFALGTEYFLTPSYPLRFGLFTNNDTRKTPSEGKTDQPDHIDYKGASLFIAMANPNSQVSLGYIYQMGQGKAQKAAGSTNIQDVVASSSTVGFSVSSSF